MPLFMAQFAYTPQAWTALIHAPQDRAAASDALLRHFGGRLIGLYYTPARSTTASRSSRRRMTRPLRRSRSLMLP
jgi:hypothetical protein